MHVVFRVDASAVIGSGHVVRCLALAETLRDRGADVSFVSCEHPGHLCGLIEGAGFPLSRLPAPLAVSGAPSHDACHSIDWQADAALTATAIRTIGLVPDWLVVDHYGIDWRWETALSASVGRLMVIDDLANRRHHAQLLLDQNLVANMHERHASTLPPGCQALIGPVYALLQPRYAAMNTSAAHRSGPVRRLLIYFGGCDQVGITRRALDAFLRLDRGDVNVDVVVGAGFAEFEALRAQVDAVPNVTLHVSLPSLAELLQKADLAVGAGGAASWERLCLGVAALVVTVADNQRETAEELHRQGLATYLGHHDAVSGADIESALARTLERGVDAEASRRSMALVDGKGTLRVAAVFDSSRDTPLRARVATTDDEALLLGWANDPVTRANAFNPAAIGAAEHHDWFHLRLDDGQRCRVYVVETQAGMPVGTVRLQRAGEAWEVHFSLSPLFRGRGMGRHMVRVAIEQLRADNMESGAVFGQVKEGNHASRRIFEALGFEAVAGDTPGVVEYRQRG